MNAEIIIALFALAGVIVTAVFQYKSSQTAQQTSREKAQADELAKTKKELDDQNSQKFRDEILNELRTLRSAQEQMQKDQAKMKTDLFGEIKAVSGRMDDIKSKITTRIEEIEMSVEILSTITVENARHYSTMLKMFESTNQRVGTLINLESQNLRYSKKIGEALIDMGEVIQDSIEDETIAKKLDEAIEAASSVRAEMIDNLISINGNMMQTSQDLSPSDESEYVKETVQKIDQCRKKTSRDNK